MQNFCTCAKLTYNCIEIIHIAQRITVIVYPSHQPTHSDPHFTSPETRINTGFLRFVNFYGLPLTFTPAAASTLKHFFEDTSTSPDDYDVIFTGDLGYVGSKLLYQILDREGIDICCKHSDCGLLLFDREKQDVHAGASGCGCSAAVLNSYVMHRFEDKSFKNVLFMSTGALMSPTSSMQGESIPGVAHLINIRI